LREFFLWKYYMTHHHGKIVEGDETSHWVDAETYAAAPPHQARPLEPVVRVDLQYWDAHRRRPGLVQRYFPLEEYGAIRDVFLSHFPDNSNAKGPPVLRRRVRELSGYYIHPRIPEASEAPE
jgi:hypothetical protein